MKWMFFAMALAYGDCVNVGKAQFGRLEVIATDATGAILKDPHVELIEIGSKKSLDVRQPVPYGTYSLRILVPGFKYSRNEVHLFQPTLRVRAELQIDPECSEPQSIHGRVKSAPVGHELWIKLVPAVGNGGTEARVGPYGDFLIAGLDFGNYLLIVMDGNKAIHTETVVANDRKSLVIQL